jgi:hypothetical protein
MDDARLHRLQGALSIRNTHGGPNEPADTAHGLPYLLAHDALDALAALDALDALDKLTRQEAPERRRPC